MEDRRLSDKTVWILTGVAAVGVIAVAFVFGPEDRRAEIILTTVLAVATLFYAATTYLSLNEAAIARRASVRPRLVPTLGLETFTRPVVGKPLLRITNFGLGVAADISVSLILEPDALPVRWVGNLAPGQSQDFRLPDTPRPPGPSVSSITDLLAQFQHLRLRGTCRDALGNLIDIDERADLKDQYRHAFGPFVEPPSESDQV